MIEPGLYQHAKSGNMYRVLFTVEWYDYVVRPRPDDVVAVYGEANVDESVSLRARVREANNPGFYGGCGLVDARWSGNDGAVKVGDPVVIYIALYAEGRVAARTLREFAEMVDVPCATFRGEKHHVARFKKVGD